MKSVEHLKQFQFKKGQSGNPNGCPKGVKMIREKAIKAFWNTFDRLGGEDELLAWANRNDHNKQTFYSWLINLTPKEAKIEGDGFGSSNITAIFEGINARARDSIIEHLRAKQS